MISWHKKDRVFYFTFSSPITLNEVEKWRTEVIQAVSQMNEDVLVFADLRECELIPIECRSIIEEVQSSFRKNGMKRSVVIVGDTITTMQLRLVAIETGIREWERYIDSSVVSDWKQLGMDWLKHNIDPDTIAKSPASSLEQQ